VFDGLSQQSAQPSEVIVVDHSCDDLTATLCAKPPTGFLGTIVYLRAEVCGAAAQRNQAAADVQQQIVWMIDDDIELYPDCVAKLLLRACGRSHLGGVNATITNQKYHSPGRLSRLMYSILEGRRVRNMGRPS